MFITKYAFAFLFLVAVSCTKEKEPEPVAPETWAHSGETYNRAQVVKRMQLNHTSSDSLFSLTFTASDLDTNSLRLSFTRPPSAGKKYLIVYAPKTDDQVSIEYWSRISRGGGSQDTPEQYLQVLDEGTRFRYVANDIVLREYTMYVDYNIKLSLNVSE